MSSTGLRGFANCPGASFRLADSTATEIKDAADTMNVKKQKLSPEVENVLYCLAVAVVTAVVGVAEA